MRSVSGEGAASGGEGVGTLVGKFPVERRKEVEGNMAVWLTSNQSRGKSELLVVKMLSWREATSVRLTWR